MSQIQLDWDKKIAILTFKPSTFSMNILDKATLKAFAETLDTILSEKELDGIILTSSANSFIAGVDLNMLGNIIKTSTNSHHKKHDILEFVLETDALFRKLERAPCPVVSAITGTCLGGGYELCLATHHRIMINQCDSRIGLPECKLGILPGLGGTVRLTRYLGVEQALRCIVQGQTLSPERALKAGLIDALCDNKKSMIQQAIQWCRDNPNACQPWDTDDFRIPGGLPYSKQGMMTWPAVSALAKSQSHNLYPAIPETLNVVYNGLQTTFDQAITLEAKSFVKILMTPQAQRMIKTLFIARQEIREEISKKYSNPLCKTVAIVGTGFMGQGIATAFAAKGFSVIMIDQSQKMADDAKSAIIESANKLIEQGRKPTTYLQNLKKHLKPTANFKELNEADVVIEAVAEDMSIKAKVLKKISLNVKKSCLITTNTSTLPITELAAHVKDPKHFCGMHFFSPVAKMQLIELIPGSLTCDETTGQLCTLSCKINKTPIVVRDTRGFYVNQVLLSYLEQAFDMLHQGVPPYLIERAATAIGMPIGPLALADEVGIDIIWHIFDSFEQKIIGTSARQVIDYLYKNKRYGRKSQAGFYDYNGKKTIWPHLTNTYGNSDLSMPFQDIKDRLFFIQIIKSLSCFDMGTVEQAVMGDYAAVFGWGFCPWTGGPFRYLDDIHRAHFIKRCKELAEAYDVNFMPNDLLIDWAEDTTYTFYSRDHVSS